MSINYDLYQKRLETSDIVLKKSLLEAKVRTFKKALKSSYNSEIVTKPDTSQAQALISEVEQSIKSGEVKKFSSLIENGFCVGDSYYWDKDKSYWLIVERLETESSIFQSYARRSIHEVKWRDMNNDIIYSTRAVNSTPEGQTINDYAKGKISLDNYTDKFRITISKNAEGVNLLKRYSEVIIGNKKWVVNILDNYSDSDLITLALVETAIDSELDDLENGVADGNVNISFVLKSNLDNIAELVLNTQINVVPILYKNGVVVNEEFFYSTVNCSNNNGLVTFNTLGTVVVKIYCGNTKKVFNYNIFIAPASSQIVDSNSIVGNSEVVTMMNESYEIISFINGQSVPAPIGGWIYDINYASTVSIVGDKINLKLNNKVGSFTLYYMDGASIIAQKLIEVLPIFGRS